MNNKTKLLTVIANADISDDDKKVLYTHTEGLSEEQMSLLIYVFMSEPKSVKAYLDFLKQLKNKDVTSSTENVKEAIESVLEKIK